MAGVGHEAMKRPEEAEEARGPYQLYLIARPRFQRYLECLDSG